MVKIKFVFDIASPNGYLCHKVIPDFEAKHSVKFDYFICLLGGIHKLSNNTPPMIAYAEIPNKNSYFSKEIERFVKFHKIENFQMNPHFPINTLTMQRGALVAEERGILMDYIDVMAKGMWEEKINLGDKDILIDYLIKMVWKVQTLLSKPPMMQSSKNLSKIQKKQWPWVLLVFQLSLLMNKCFGAKKL